MLETSMDFTTVLAWITTILAFFNAMLFTKLFIDAHNVENLEKTGKFFIEVLLLCIAFTQYWFGMIRLLLGLNFIGPTQLLSYNFPGFLVVTFFGLFIWHKFHQTV